MNRLDDPSPAAPPSLEDPRVIAAVEEYLAALEAGREPDRDQFLAGYAAEVAAALAVCLDGLELVRAAGPDLQPSFPAEPPPALGDFRLIREVGRGGMGVVYEAEQISLRRRVALKVLSLAGGLDARQLQRFRTEAQAAAGLHHINVAPVYAVGCERGVHYYAMQFIDGPSLAEVIAALRQEAGLPPAGHERRGRTAARFAVPAATEADSSTIYRPIEALDEVLAAAPTRPNAALTTEHPADREFWRTVARLGIEAAEALDHAHQQGIVHRDVKPANLLLDGSRHLWIVDFGLARLQSDAGLTMTGDVVGTLRYMSPEQAIAGRELIDHRTDVYSLGTTLYELLTLTPAFPGDDRQNLLRRVTEDEPPAPRRVAPAIPADLEVIVLKAMAKEPSERYATARDLADDLRRFLEDRPIVARRPSLAQRARRWARRHRSLVVSLSAAAALLLAGLVVGLLDYAHKQSQLAKESDAATKEVERQKQEVQAKLYDALLKSARAARLARQPGYRAEVWDNLRQAMALDVPAKDPLAIAAELLAGLGDPIGLDPVPAPAAARLPRPPLPGWFEAGLQKPVRDGVPRAATPEGNVVAEPVGETVYLYSQPPGFAIAPQQLTGPQGFPRNTFLTKSSLGQVYDLEFTRDTTHLAAGCEGGLAVWTLHATFVETQACYYMILHSLIRCGNVSSVALHPEGRLVATVGREVRLWSFPDGRPIASLPLPAGASRVEFSADGQLLLAVAAGRAVVGWPVGDTPEKLRLYGQRGAGVPSVAFSLVAGPHGSGVPAVTFSPDGRRIVSVSKDKTIRTWDPATGQQLASSSGGHNGEIEAVAISPDGRLLATGDFDGAVYVRDAADGKELPRLADPYFRLADRKEPPGQVWRLQFDGTGNHLAAGGGRGVAVWSIRPGERGPAVQRCAAVNGPEVYDVAFHPSGSSLAYLAKTSKEGRAELYRFDLGAESARPLGVAARLQVRGMNFDSSGRLLTFVTPGGSLGRWDWEKGAVVPGPDLPAFQWAPAPGGRWVATCGPDNGVVVHDIDAGARLLALPPEESDVWCLSWAPDGQRLALGLSDGTIVVWDLEQVRARLAEFGIAIPSTRPPP
jgi:serine/threonine protein kinase/WD40 repeat protein